MWMNLWASCLLPPLILQLPPAELRIWGRREKEAKTVTVINQSLNEKAGKGVQRRQTAPTSIFVTHHYYWKSFRPLTLIWPYITFDNRVVTYGLEQPLYLHAWWQWQSEQTSIKMCPERQNWEAGVRTSVYYIWLWADVAMMGRWDNGGSTLWYFIVLVYVWKEKIHKSC